MTAKERDVIYPVVVVLAHSVHLGINPPLPLPSKTPPLSFKPSTLPLICKLSKPYILAFPDPLFLKLVFFHESQKYLNFSSFAPSYLLKVTKFLNKISQFAFLVMTEQSILVYKRFLSKVKNSTHPALSQQPLYKN